MARFDYSVKFKGKWYEPNTEIPMEKVETVETVETETVETVETVETPKKGRKRG